MNAKTTKGKKHYNGYYKYYNSCMLFFTGEAFGTNLLERHYDMVKKKDKEEYLKFRRSACELIVEQGKTQKEAARLLGVTEKTISGWASEGGWRELRKIRQSSANTARDNILRIIRILSEKRINLESEINSAIDTDNKELELQLRSEANSLSVEMSKQRKNLESMEKENKLTLGQYVDVFDEIFSDLRKTNLTLFEQTIDFQTLHLRKKSNELG